MYISEWMQIMIVLSLLLTGFIGGQFLFGTLTYQVNVSPDYEEQISVLNNTISELNGKVSDLQDAEPNDAWIGATIIFSIMIISTFAYLIVCRLKESSKVEPVKVEEKVVVKSKKVVRK